MKLVPNWLAEDLHGPKKMTNQSNGNKQLSDPDLRLCRLQHGLSSPAANSSIFGCSRLLLLRSSSRRAEDSELRTEPRCLQLLIERLRPVNLKRHIL